MVTNSNLPVLFGFGTYAEYESKMKSPNKLYFCSDTKEIYLGPDRFAFGKDVNIQITGSGDTVASASWDLPTKTLTIALGQAGSAASVTEAIQSALTDYVKNVSADMNSAIVVNNSDKNNIDVSLNLATGEFAGNVKLTQSYHGLKAQAEIPQVPVEGVAANDKIISLTNRELASTLSITTEKALDGRQYIILKGINGVEISRFDASVFVTSGMIQSVTIQDLPVPGGGTDKFLVITFITADGTSTVQVDLEEIIEVYTAAVDGGLTLNGSTNAFSITNTVTPNTAGVNTDKTVTFGSNLTLNTITYDAHGSITGTKQITIQIPSLDPILQPYEVKSFEVTGSGNTVNNISFNSGTGKITATKGDFPTLSKGTSPTPETQTLQPGGTFVVETGTTVSQHQITDNMKEYILPAYSGDKGINVNGTTVSLPDEFYNYLVEQTYLTPVISSFSVTGLGSSAEIGTSVSITSIVHQETNITNISGTLTLKHGSVTLKSGISPSATSSTVSLDSAETVTRTSAGTETFTLSGTNTLGGSITKSVSKTFYVPKFLGASESSSVAASDILTFSKGQSIPTSITISGAAKYIYFVTDGTISSVKDADTGFGVPLETAVNQSVTINSVPVSYKVYRTSDKILAGTYHFTIT